MKFKLIFILFNLMVFYKAQSQIFEGFVLDQQDSTAIEYAEVYFSDIQTGTMTDDKGKFVIDHFTQHKLRVQISYIGYKTLDMTIDIEKPYRRTFYLEPSHYELKEVVISASIGKLQQESVVSVQHVNMQTLQQTSPITLAESISNIPGVEQNTTGAGIGKPIIRGLSGNRIVTYAQGIRIENQQWGDEHGLGVGEIGIESVEVIKGPASLLYGSDAMGGVLYFIDERYARHNTYELSVGSKLLSNTLGTINDFGFKIHRNKYKFNLFGGLSSHADYRVPELHRINNTRFVEKNIKSSFGFNTQNWISNLRYSYLQNKFGITEDAIYHKRTERSFVLPFQIIDNHNLSFENTLFLNDSEIKATLGYTTNYRREYEDDTNNQALGLKLNTSTYNLKWKSPLVKDHFSFVLGSQGMFQENINDGEEVLIPDAKTTDVGIFGLTNIEYDQLQIQTGIRWDNRQINAKETRNIKSLSNNYSGITYSAGLVHTRDKAKYRINISSGFRAPNTSELLSDGVHEGTIRYEKGNKQLIAEHATQVDISFDFHNDHFQFSINPFYNHIQNYIFLSPTSDIIDDFHVYEYLQNNAQLYGGEMGIHYHPHHIHWLHLESNISTVIAEDENSNPLPLRPKTKINTTISTEFSSSKNFHLTSLYLQHIYKFKQDRIGLFESYTPSYNLFNMGINAELETNNHSIELSLGVKNIFNTKYIDHLSRFKSLNVSNQGFNFYLGLRYSIMRKTD